MNNDVATQYTRRARVKAGARLSIAINAIEMKWIHIDTYIHRNGIDEKRWKR